MNTPTPSVHNDGIFPLRLLMLEDSDDDCELVLRALKQGGFAVQHVRVWDAKSFQRELEGARWDVVISDFQMPGFTGLEALQLSRAKGFDLPFIIVSGTVGEDLAVELIKAGASDYLMKDRLLRLAPAVKRELEQAHTRNRLADSERQVQQTQRLEAIGRLAGGVAHDFNNLLGVILMYCDLFLKRMPKDDVDYADMEQIKKAGESGAALTQQLLAFSRKQVLEPRVIDVNQLITNLQKMLGRLIGEDIQLEAILDPDLLRVRIDPGQLEQVLINLVVNSRDALPNGGLVRIRTRNMVTLEGPSVRISVEDTGQGMSLETQTQIFEPFFTTKGPRKGTGLGLSTAFGIVKQSGGYFEVESELGQGSQFHMYLPGVDLPPETTAKAAPAAKRAREDKRDQIVMVIDDDLDLRAVICRSLEREGYKVAPPVTPAEAIAYVDAGKPLDLLVTDMVMPTMSGPELATRLVEKNPNIRVLMMSGYLDDVLDRFEAMRENMNFLAKPFASRQFLGMVRMALGEE